MAGDMFSVTRTGDELSVMCREELVPAGTQPEVGWFCLRVAGTMPLTLARGLASLTAPVAAAGVGLFAISNLDTDDVLVIEADFATAIDALRAAGHRVEQADGSRLNTLSPAGNDRVKQADLIAENRPACMRWWSVPWGSIAKLHSGGETLHRLVGPAIANTSGWVLPIHAWFYDPDTGLREYEHQAAKFRKGWGLNRLPWEASSCRGCGAGMVWRKAVGR